MKKIGIYQENATCFDRAYAKQLLNDFSHLEYIKKKLLPGMKLVECDFETGEMTDL